MENIEFKINDLVANGKLEISNLLEDYKNCDKDISPLEMQFYLFYNSMAEDFFKHDGKKALENYEKALKFSIKDYELGKIPNARLLTKTELLILNNISRTQYFLDEKDAAIDLMEFLKSYFEKRIMNEEEITGEYVPVKGVKVMSQQLGVFGIDVTNKNGKFSIPRAYTSVGGSGWAKAGLRGENPFDNCYDGGGTSLVKLIESWGYFSENYIMAWKYPTTSFKWKDLN